MGTLVSSQYDGVAAAARPQCFGRVRGIVLPLLLIATIASFSIPNVTGAADSSSPDVAAEGRLRRLIPRLEAYIERGMKAFDAPGLAIGIVARDRLVTRTVFAIGSTTKGFLSATMAIMVDRDKLRWDDRIVDLYPDFQMQDPWVTREFRLFDIVAQRSGLPGLANDALGMLAFGKAQVIRSFRHVEPVSSFRSTFAYTNVTHLLAGRIVANAAGAPDWNVVLQQELLDPLGMRDSSYTAAAIEAAANHAKGYHWTPAGTSEVPFTQIFPYDFGAAGDLNSTVEDLAHWVRLQLGNGTFEGRQIVSPQSLAFTRTPKVAISDHQFYALGWLIQQTPRGNMVWHNGDALSSGSFIGLLRDSKIGVVVLSNEQNVGFEDAIGLWVLDRILGNPEIDYVTAALQGATAAFEARASLFAKPVHPRPVPPLAPLAGTFTNPSFGRAVVTLDAETLVMELEASGAKFNLEPWDGDVFIFQLLPLGKFAPIVDLGYMTKGFAQFQMDTHGQLNAISLSFENNQTYEFSRE
jgi:CubicO group peptidase (beta-lactamase class C family)